MQQNLAAVGDANGGQSASSSPYLSPALGPKGRPDDVDIPSLHLPDPSRPRIPARRGAVSGASSGPSAPFPSLTRIIDRDGSAGPSRLDGGIMPSSSSSWSANGVAPAYASSSMHTGLPGMMGPQSGAYGSSDPYGSFGMPMGASSWGPEDARYKRRISVDASARFNPYGGYHMGMRDHQDPNAHPYFGPDAKPRLRSGPRVHSDAPRNFCCAECPARFSRNHDLKRHQRGHLAVRPFPCPFCGKSFSRKDALKRHMMVKGCGVGGSDAKKKAGADGDKLEGGSSDDGNADDSSSFHHLDGGAGRGRSTSALSQTPTTHSVGGGQDDGQGGAHHGHGMSNNLYANSGMAFSASPSLPQSSMASFDNGYGQPQRQWHDSGLHGDRQGVSSFNNPLGLSRQGMQQQQSPDRSVISSPPQPNAHYSAMSGSPPTSYHAISGGSGIAPSNGPSASRLYAIAQEHTPVIRHRNSLDISALLSS